MNFVTAVAYHSCLNEPATIAQPRTSIISWPSTIIAPYLPVPLSHVEDRVRVEPGLVRRPGPRARVRPLHSDRRLLALVDGGGLLPRRVHLASPAKLV